MRLKAYTFGGNVNDDRLVSLDQLNWLHLPTPAVRVYPQWQFYLLYI